MASFRDEPVLPFESNFFSDLFSVVDRGSTLNLPSINLNGEIISFGGTCIIELHPAGRRYLFIKPKMGIVEHLSAKIRTRQAGNVSFRVIVRPHRNGRLMALVLAIQDGDTTLHPIAIVRADSIPEETDVPG